MEGASIGTTVIPTAPIALCLATMCAISTSLKIAYTKKEKKFLKEYNILLPNIESSPGPYRTFVFYSQRFTCSLYTKHIYPQAQTYCFCFA